MVQGNLDFGTPLEIKLNWLGTIRSDTLPDDEKESVIKLALKVIEDRFECGEKLSDSASVKDYLQLKISEYKREVFCVLFLDTQHRLIAYQEMFHGTLGECSVYPREIARRALELNAGAAILAHQHPSGIAEPSRADIQTTEHIAKVMRMIEVRVLDHLVVSQTEVVSFAERGLI